MFKKLLQLKTLLVVCLSAMVGTSNVWGQTSPYYTLDTTGDASTGNNSYAGSGTATVGGIEWAFEGNGTTSPWRLGGKSITKTDRAAYTKTAMGKAISSVDLTVGAASNITVNSLKLIVASDESFTSVIDEVSRAFEANSTITFKPTSDECWTSNSYYKFVFNVTVSATSNKFVQFSKVEFYEYISSGSTLIDSDLGIAPEALDFDLYNNSSAQTVSYTTSSTGAVTVSGGTGYVNTIVDETNKTITVTPVKVTPSAQTITVSQAADDTYAAGTATFTVSVADNTPDPYIWEETGISDLTSSDVFVIVGDNGDTYALPNNNGTSAAPGAVKVTIVNNTLENAPADNLKWSISGNATDGYTFYPKNGSTETWLYCTNTNNGVRVGTNDDNKTFTVKDNYLYNTATKRYLGVYNSQDWRCYTSINDNIQNQKFAFYKRVPVKTVVMIDEEHYATLYHGTNLKIPSGVVAKTVTVDDEGILTVEEITGDVIPALTGVLLYAAESDNTEYTFNGTDEENSVDITDNNLTGVLTDQTVIEDGYVFFKLADGADGLGFYYDHEGGASINAKAGKAFLRVSNEQAQGIRGFVLSDAKTGVAEFTMQKKQREAYDLQGRRVSTPKNGLYIINGKKVFVK